MRTQWTLHPKYLAANGAGRELWPRRSGAEGPDAVTRFLGLPASRRNYPLRGNYRHPPADAGYLLGSRPRGGVLELDSCFTPAKISLRKFPGKIEEIAIGRCFRWRHLKRKLKQRDPKRLRANCDGKIPAPHPLFEINSRQGAGLGKGDATTRRPGFRPG